MSEARYARTTTGRQRPSRWKTPSGDPVRPAEANGADVHQAITRVVQLRKQVTRPEPTRRGYGYQGVRWQKSVRRIARRPGRRAARRGDGARLAEESSASRAGARGGGSEARTVRVSCSETNPGIEHGRGLGQHPARRDTTEGIPIAALDASKDAAGRRSRSRRFNPRGERRKTSTTWQLPVGPGPGQVVPAATTKDVRDRDVRGEGCSSR